MFFVYPFHSYLHRLEMRYIRYSHS